MLEHSPVPRYHPPWLGSALDPTCATSGDAHRHRPDRSATGCQPPTPPSRAPAKFAVKLSAQDDTVRERVAIGYRSEVEFYNKVADRMSIPVPPEPSTSEISEDGADFVLLLADMAPAVQGDQIPGCPPTRHGWRWKPLQGCTVRVGAIRSGWTWRPS